MSSPKTAAALVIGNELLTGKIRDCNTVALGRLLFESGVSLRRVVQCPDEVTVIADELLRLSLRYDLLVTSGGIGPTHDDVTVEAVARAFDRPLVHSPEIDALLRRFFGSSFGSGHERMSQIPDGAELVAGDSQPWPLLKMRNVFVLPGLPKIFIQQLEILRKQLAGDAPFISRAVHARVDEEAISDLLAQLHRDYPEVVIGSYPRVGEECYRVAVTFDGRDSEHVDRAVRALLKALPPDQIVDQA